MALMEEISERGLGLPLGIGIAVAAVSAGPKIIKAGRPLMKSAIKGYLAIQAKGKEMFAESAERMQDVYAEARHEYDEEMKVKAEGEHEEEKPAEGKKPSAKAKKEKEESEEGEKE